MKKYVAISVFIFFAVIWSCATNPFSGERTLALTPNSQIFPAAFQQYNQFLSTNKVVTGTADATRVNNVGSKIKVAAERWLTANGQKDYLKDYQWEYKLVDSKEVNAWCMPGGKIVVYTGILPIAKDDAGLAAIMGHEVAHALANHGQQRMSAGMFQQLGAVGLGLLTNEKSPELQQTLMQAYGVGSQVLGMLPFSRAHENEADKIGLTLMAIAGYEPANAAAIWERMSAKAGNAAPPEMLSTHPANDTRIANIRSQIRTAKLEAAKFGVTTFR